jgi:hypothetical protein
LSEWLALLRLDGRHRVQIPDLAAAYHTSYFMSSLCVCRQYFEVGHGHFSPTFFEKLNCLETGFDSFLRQGYEWEFDCSGFRWADRQSRGSCRIYKNVPFQNPCLIEINQTMCRDRGRINPAVSLQINK